jgi:hypothetical protein
VTALSLDAKNTKSAAIVSGKFDGKHMMCYSLRKHSMALLWRQRFHDYDQDKVQRRCIQVPSILEQHFGRYLHNNEDTRKCNSYHVPASAFKIKTALSCTRKIRLGDTPKTPNQVSNVQAPSNLSSSVRSIVNQANTNCTIKPIRHVGVKMLVGKMPETERGEIAVDF